MERPQKYTSHSNLLNADNMYECPECGKAFPKYVSLYKHRRIHTGERPYGCQICGRRFVQKVHLTIHTRMHTGEKPFECEECNKKFAKKYHLTNHMRVHTGLRPLACDVCDKRFGSSSTLKNHKRTHIPEKQFKCDLCERAYRYPTNLKVHVAQYHFGEKPIRCEEEECREGFWDRFQLKRHMIKVHKKVYPKKSPTLEKYEAEQKAASKEKVTSVKKEPIQKTSTETVVKNDKIETTVVTPKVEKPPEATQKTANLITQPQQEQQQQQCIQVNSDIKQQLFPVTEQSRASENSFESQLNMTRQQPLIQQPKLESQSLQLSLIQHQQHSLQQQQIHQQSPLLPMQQPEIQIPEYSSPPPPPTTQMRPLQLQLPQNFINYHQVTQMSSIQQPYSNRQTFPEHLIQQFGQIEDESCSPSNSPGQPFINSPPSSPEPIQQQHRLPQPTPVQVAPQSIPPSPQQPPPLPPPRPPPPPVVTSRVTKQQQSGKPKKPRAPKPRNVDCPQCDFKFYDRYALKRHMIQEHHVNFTNANPRNIIKKPPLDKPVNSLQQQQTLTLHQQQEQHQSLLVQQQQHGVQHLQTIPQPSPCLSLDSSSQQSHHSSQNSDMSAYQQPQQNYLQQNALNYSATNFMNAFNDQGQFRNN